MVCILFDIFSPIVLGMMLDVVSIYLIFLIHSNRNIPKLFETFLSSK